MNKKQSNPKPSEEAILKKPMPPSASPKKEELKGLLNGQWPNLELLDDQLPNIPKARYTASKKFLGPSFISIEQCHARYNENAKRPPPGPPNREYKVWPIVGMVETKKSIQAMRDYKNYMRGWGDGFESGRVK